MGVTAQVATTEKSAISFSELAVSTVWKIGLTPTSTGTGPSGVCST